MDIEQLNFLASSPGQQRLDALQGADLSAAQTLPLLTQLRQQVPAEHAAAILTMARLRESAVSKFGEDAHRLFFTPDALEQASDPLVRRYRARITAGQTALDVGCGIGSDSMAMARAGAVVQGLDIDPLRVAIARHNAATLRLNARFDVHDVREGVPDGYDVLFYDPARRDAAGKRIYDVEHYLPPLSLVRDWRAGQRLVKLSPGVDLAQLVAYGGHVEFISVAGALKEAVLWLDSDKPSTGVLQTQATLLQDDVVYHWMRDAVPHVAIDAPQAWLIEPDAAIIRAGLVQDVAQTMHGTLLDETIAYFTTPDKPQSVWVRVWQVLDWMPYNLKKLRAYLRERGIGRVTVKKRGSPITPEELISKLKLGKFKGNDASCTLVLTRYQGQAVVIVCADYVA